jgi:hypothetical protein
LFAAAEKMRLALVPPNPKELVMACVMAIGAGRCAIRFNAVPTSVTSHLMAVPHPAPLQIAHDQ